MGFLHSLYNRYTPGNTRLPVHTGSQQVFIVHGHDNDMIESIKNIICELNLSPLVLREQPDKGKTIIEKLEEHLGNCKCAIVLYTPCDKGAKHDSDDYKPRARQNVVYEHGLLQGYLGRPRIIVVQKDDTELMGDCQGIIVVKTSETDWKEHIKREIEAIDKM
jgi:predicted nucleotide-binding protein